MFLRDLTCNQCQKLIKDCSKDVHSIIFICANCKKEYADNLKNAHFKKLDKLTTDERLRLLEEAQYTKSLIKPIIPYDPHAVYGDGTIQ